MVGAMLGVYRVDEEIGRGGMGQVYRAHDTSLNRDVAIKVLPDGLGSDPDRLMRFEREAKALAALNHPNIAHVYGLEKSGDTPAIVMELVDGPTLADRIAQGPIPLAEALPIARQIAEGLEAAHERGIIHRDLKPANIKVTDDGTVKLLDFGLAKALAPDPTSAEAEELANSPTLTARATQMGVILGTAAYMAPEQAKGKPVDKRVDVWAFGVVLYEMLTGTRPFDGSDASEVIARVIDREPDWEVLPATTPRAVERLLHRCLVKQRRDRLHDIGDARLELDAADSVPSEVVGTETGRRRWLVQAVVLTVAAFAAGLVVSPLLSPSPPASVRRFDITLPSTHRFPPGVGSLLAISPDGQRMAYVATSEGIQRIYHRRFDTTEFEPLIGTEGGTHPFFSPDSRVLGFAGLDGSLWTMSLEGGTPQKLVTLETGLGYAAWRSDGTVVFSRGAGGIWSVDEAGGVPKHLVDVDASIAPDGVERLDLLPGEEWVVAEARAGSTADTVILLVSLVTGEAVQIAQGSDPAYVETGHLVFARLPGELWAVPFNANQMRSIGDQTRILADLRVESGGAAHFAAARDGTLLYVPGTVGEVSLAWMDRAGNASEIRSGVNIESPRLSPDGKRVAFTQDATAGSNTEVWIFDLPAGPARRLTSDNADFALSWEPDGQRVLFSSSTRDTRSGIYGVSSDFGRQGPALVGLSGSQEGLARIRGGDVSPDGRLLAFQSIKVGADAYIELLKIGSEEPAVPLIDSPSGADVSPAISPDGQWIAYVSNGAGTGRYEVMVTRFPESGPTHQISIEGGVQPVWASSGRELFYRHERTLFAVPVELGPTFQKRGTATALFDVDLDPSPDWWRPHYDYDAKSDRFVVARNKGSESIRFRAVLNWFDELKARVPGR